MILSDEVQRFVREQRLGFVATVNEDGSPNLSPKGTTTVFDDDHLVFADIRSPGTVANLRRDPRVEVQGGDARAQQHFDVLFLPPVLGPEVGVAALLLPT